MMKEFKTRRPLICYLAITLCILIVAPLLFTIQVDALAEWIYVGERSFTESQAWNISIDTNNAGIPFIAYAESQYGKVSVIKNDGSGWTFVGSPGFSIDGTDSPCLALDSKGTPYVAYFDYGADRKATVMKYTGAGASGWEPVGVRGFTQTEIQSISLAIDSTDSPYVAFSTDVAHGYKASVMKYSEASGWEFVGNPYFSKGISAYFCLKIDQNDVPYLSYIDFLNFRRVTLMKLSGSSWQCLSNSLSAGEAVYTSLAFGKDGYPIVAFADRTYTDRATVMALSESGWHSLGSAGFTPGVAYYPSLDVGSDGTPYLAFSNGVSNNDGSIGDGYKAALMKFGGNSWEFVGSTGFSANVAYHVAFKLDENDTPFVAYQEYFDGYRLSVMKFMAKHTVSFNVDGGSAVADQLVFDGNTATMPVSPLKTGFTFAGWYTSSDFTTPFDFAKPIIEDTIVYAKWLPVECTTVYVPASVQYSDPISLQAKLQYGETPIVGKKMTFEINGQIVGTAITSSEGIASLGNITIGQQAGNYQVKAYYVTKKIRSAEGTAGLLISSETSSIQYSGLVQAKAGKPFSISAIVSQEEDGYFGNLSLARVNFSISGNGTTVSYLVGCNSAGIASKKISLPSGSYSITAKVENDGYYISAQTTADLIVQ